MQHNELIQDFIFRDLPSTSNKRDFNQRMQSFLERIPNHFGQYTKNFFIGMFIGALYHFEYTEKKEVIEGNYGRVRSFYHYDRNDCVLHMVFVVGEESSYLRSLVFSKEGKLSEPDDTIWTRIHRSDLVKNFSFSQKSAAKIYYKNQEGFVWEEQPIVTREKNKAFDIEAAIFSKLNEKGFIEIRPLPLTKVSPETINEYQVEIFGNNNIGIVEIAVKSYLTSSKKIYQQGLGDFNNLFGEDFVKKEAFSHGFLFGGLGLNHYLYIYPERVVGSGLVDIMLASPISQNPIPILIEDKAGTISAKEGIDQIVTTYADTTVPARGFQITEKGQKAQGIIAAVNYSLKPTADRQLRSDEITVKIVPIKPVNRIIEQFFEVCREIRMIGKISCYPIYSICIVRVMELKTYLIILHC